MSHNAITMIPSSKVDAFEVLRGRIEGLAVAIRENMDAKRDMLLRLLHPGDEDRMRDEYADVPPDDALAAQALAYLEEWRHRAELVAPLHKVLPAWDVDVWREYVATGVDPIVGARCLQLAELAGMQPKLRLVPPLADASDETAGKDGES